MKHFSIYATVAVFTCAVTGYVVGTLLADGDSTWNHEAAATHSGQHEAVTPGQPLVESDETNVFVFAAEAKVLEGTQRAEAAQLTDVARSGPHLVSLANVTIPVRKGETITFVVADVAVEMANAERAAHYKITQNADRLQAAIEAAMARAAETPVLRGVTIDSDLLSGNIKAFLKEASVDVEDVLFLTLYKHDIGYN